MPDEVLDDVDFDEVLGVEDNEPTPEEQAEVQPKKQAAPKPATKPATKTVATKPASTTVNKPGPKTVAKPSAVKAATKPGPKPSTKPGPKPVVKTNAKPISISSTSSTVTGEIPKESALTCGFSTLFVNLQILAERVAQAESSLIPVLRKGPTPKAVVVAHAGGVVSFGTQLAALNTAAVKIEKHLTSVIERLEV